MLRPGTRQRAPTSAGNGGGSGVVDVGVAEDGVVEDVEVTVVVTVVAVPLVVVPCGSCTSVSGSLRMTVPLVLTFSPFGVTV